MTPCIQIITLALSKLGIAGGAKAPQTADLELGLTTLQGLYRNFISSGALGRANNRVVSGDYVAGENDRILRQAGSSGTIELPETVSSAPNAFVGGYDYGMASHRDCRVGPPRNGSFVVINDAQTGETAEFIYDGYRNAWTSIDDLNLDDGVRVYDPDGSLLEVRTSIAPLSQDINGLAAVLALRLADHYGATLHKMTVTDAVRFEGSLVTGFGEADDNRVPGEYW